MTVSIEQYTSIYVDVDGTLLFWPGKKKGHVPRPGEKEYGKAPEINQPLVNALKNWHKGNNVLVLWSKGGVEHCEKAASRCDLNPDACLPKPQVAIDDSTKTVTPNERRGFCIMKPSDFD